MKYLLDTKPFLLWDSDADQLPPRVLAAIKSPQNEIYVSLASVREIQLKTQIGMIDLGTRLMDIFTHQRDVNRITILPIGLKQSTFLTQLPNIHHDPFDRLILAQALADNMTIITNDPLITQYAVKTWW